MAQTDARPLHLHTLDSLIADLVSGRAIRTASGDHHSLQTDQSRSALNWYRLKGAANWTSQVRGAIGEELVDAILDVPPELPSLGTRSENANVRRLRLRRVEAHRFAGLHKFGTPGAPPPNYVAEFTSALTIFEGRNGSGKTSLLNAIIWALTGEILRPQRMPEVSTDFVCIVDAANEQADQTAHKLSSITPMPNVDQYRPDEAWVPSDTWVELTFVDETGVDLPAIRRSQTRGPRGKLAETKPDLSVLAVDPIAIRIGTIMPALLPLIKIGSESELGRAVSELTGLSALVDLADHARRAKAKIDGEFTKSKKQELERADQNYGLAKEDLEKVLRTNPELSPPNAVPVPSDNAEIEKVLTEISDHFLRAKGTAFEAARGILGERFVPTDPTLLSDLETNIGGAIERTRQPKDLASAARLGELRKLTHEQLNSADAKISNIVKEAKTLETLAADPSTAARTRLYACVATWVADHQDYVGAADVCLVCGANLEIAKDPVTGKLVKLHLQEAASDSVLLSQTLTRWSKSVLGDLLQSLPDVLRAELARDLPAHPCDLLRNAIVDELFDFNPFRGVLVDLKAQTETEFDKVVLERSELMTATEFNMPTGCGELQEGLERLDRALRFARWRQSNDALAFDIVRKVLGQVPKEDETKEKSSLISKLLDLHATVTAAEPITDALTQCDRLKRQLALRRSAEKRLGDYGNASEALSNIMDLGRLADEQVDELRVILRDKAAAWRSKIYLGAFPDTAHELTDTRLGRKGELDLVVRTGGVSAPAQHVTNASALRASLVAFFLSFWEHVLKERGGLALLLFDDPQELLDDENRERLASALAPLQRNGAQLIITSHDARFSTRVSRLPIEGGVAHFEVLPATLLQSVLRTTPHLPMISSQKNRFEADLNIEDTARSFANSCRLFLEAKLGDMFDDPAHAAWAINNANPTLSSYVSRLRPLVRSSPQGMFSARIFLSFVDHSALADGSPVIELMNKAHHGRYHEIRAADVAQWKDDLVTLTEMVEKMHEECYRWRRRDEPRVQVVPQPKPQEITDLEAMAELALDVLICPDLAAFTEGGFIGDTQENAEVLHADYLESAAVFYLRRENFGFAAPSGSLAIVESIQGPAVDRRLAIARHENGVFARRVVRSTGSEEIGLTADVVDPRHRSPKTVMFPVADVAVHQVMGIVFDHSIDVGPGQDEAVLVDASQEFKKVEIAYRVIGNSAVPLALDKQIILGGSRIELAQLERHEDAFVALTLDDGSSVFKRVGAALPDDLRHLRQFESIGGLGSSQVLSIGKQHNGFRRVMNARLIFGVLYHG